MAPNSNNSATNRTITKYDDACYDRDKSEISTKDVTTVGVVQTILQEGIKADAMNADQRMLWFQIWGLWRDEWCFILMTYDIVVSKAMNHNFDIGEFF